MVQTFSLVWSEFRVEAEDFIDAGDKVVVIGQWFTGSTEALRPAGLGR